MKVLFLVLLLATGGEAYKPGIAINMIRQAEK